MQINEIYLPSSEISANHVQEEYKTPPEPRLPYGVTKLIRVVGEQEIKK